MAEAATVALSKIVMPVANELKTRIKGIMELPDKVELIRMELTSMKNVVQDLGAAHLTNKVVNGWVGEVRKLAYHVEDVMEKYSYYHLQQEEDGFLMKFLIKGPRYAVIFNEIVGDVDKILKDIEHVTKMKERWLDPSQLAPNKHSDIEKQRSQVPELVKDEDLVGVESLRLSLTGWLYSQLGEHESSLITVSGMGGLGKTALVTNVFEREKIRFSVHAWITVSQTYTVEDILKKLIRKIGSTEQARLAHMDVHDLKEKIKEELMDKKCLIVLDDVWEREAYTQIEDAFHNLQECRIIITTRKKHVATLASQARQLELQPLGVDDAFKLFCRRAFYHTEKNECHPELQKLATSITVRCKGLPLAIVSIGSMMSSKQQTEHAWQKISNQIQSELAKNDNVKAIMNLSYYDLPGDLRNCFLYCSLFPKNYLMHRDTLVRLWVAEGFADRREDNTPEDVAEGNLMELIHRNMLEVVDNDELGRVSTCKMHDILRDLALSVAKEEKFGSGKDSGTIMLMDKEIRRLSTHEWHDKSRSKAPFLHLRTIISLATMTSPNGMLSSILSESIYLTVLELEDSDITEVPESIGTLFNLRYIGLRRTRIKSIPDSIEKLPNLTTLDIKQTQIEKLPRGISKVKKLRHLLADRYADEKQSEFRYFIGVQLPKDFSHLEELQTLETVEANQDLAKQLEKLTKLESVWIDNISSADCRDLFATLSKMKHVSSLLLSASDKDETLCFETLKLTDESRLHKLIVRGRWAQASPIFLSHAKNLKYLALSWCQFVEDPLQQLATHTPNLTYLSLNRVNSTDTLVLDAARFPKLKILILKNLPDVNRLQINHKVLPPLEGLYMLSMLKLDKVPEGIEYLRSLKKLWLLRLHKDFKTHWEMNGMDDKMHHVEIKKDWPKI